jgi:plasmid stabilization system protein ParE
MRVEFLQGAEADLLEVYIRLEERRAGAGESFYRALDAALERLRAFPAMAPMYLAPYRRLVLRPFNLGVFFTIAGERVMVGAILDLRQDPELIKRRLSR